MITIRGGGGGRWTPLEFLVCRSISRLFYLQLRAFDFSLQDDPYFMGGLGACDVTNIGCHLGFYQELEIRLKPREMVIFCAWDEK